MLWFICSPFSAAAWTDSRGPIGNSDSFLQSASGQLSQLLRESFALAAEQRLDWQSNPPQRSVYNRDVAGGGFIMFAAANRTRVTAELRLELGEGEQLVHHAVDRELDRQWRELPAEQKKLWVPVRDERSSGAAATNGKNVLCLEEQTQSANIKQRVMML